MPTISLDKKYQSLKSVLAKSTASMSLQGSYTFHQQIRKRYWVNNILMFFLQYMGLIVTTLGSQHALTWFASGSACAFVFLRAHLILPGLFWGSFFAYYLASFNLGLALSCALILTLQALSLLKLNYRYSIFSLVFWDFKDFFKFLVLSVLLTASGSLSLVLICFPLTMLQWPLFISWFLANFNGVLILSSALMTLDAYFPEFHQLKNIYLPRLLQLYIAEILLILGLILSSHGLMISFFMILIFMNIIVIARQWRWCGVMAALFILSLALSLANYFDARFFFLPFPGLLLYLQIFLSLTAIIGMIVALYYEKKYF